MRPFLIECGPLPVRVPRAGTCLLAIVMAAGVIGSEIAGARPPGTVEQAGDERENDDAFRAEVEALVRDLDAADLATRESAEARLVELGVDVLTLLPEVTPSTPADVKERLGRVVQTLEKELAAGIAAGSRITLQGTHSLADALAALEEQTGNRIAGYRQRSGMVEVDFQDVLYWEAVDQLLDQVGLTINPFGGSRNALDLTGRAEDQVDRYGSAHYEGLFRFEVPRVEAQRDLRNPGADELRLRLQIAWEPRITPITLAVPLDQVIVQGDTGASLIVKQAGGSRSAPAMADISTVDLDLPLELPDRSVGSVDRLEGTLIATLPGRIATFEFTDLEEAEAAVVRRAGVAVTLERIRRNRDVHEIYLGIRFDEAAGAFESHMGWIFNNECYLVDENDVRVENAGYQLTRQQQSDVGIAYRFVLDEPIENYRLVYRSPAMIIRLPVPFVLEDIPLP